MCHGFGFIVILTVIVYVGLVYYNILVPLLGETISKHLVGPLSKAWGKMFSYVIVQVVFGLAIIAALVTFIAIDAKGAECAVTQIYHLKIYLNYNSKQNSI